MHRPISEKPDINEYFRALPLEGKKWMYSTKSTKLEKINAVLVKDIIPMLDKDCDEISIMDIKGNMELRVKFHKLCQYTLESFNKTLSLIQDVLQEKVFPYLKIVAV